MIWNRKANGPADEPVDIEALDPALKQALGEFKASVRGWSDAAYGRSRGPREVVVRRRKFAVGLSFAAVLLAGALSGGLYQQHRERIAAEFEAQRAAEQQRQADAKQRALEAQKDEEILASVDKDLSREVPSAMEPLAQLGAEGESQ
jgi:hypothetical protein